MTPLRHAGARHVIRNVGLLQHLANELRAEPVGVREVTTGVAPPLEVVEGETVLGVVPDITGKQRNLHALGIELCLHGVAFQLLRIHAAVTVTQCLLLSAGLSPLKTFILYHDFCHITQIEQFSSDQ